MVINFGLVLFFSVIFTVINVQSFSQKLNVHLIKIQAHMTVIGDNVVLKSSNTRGSSRKTYKFL